MPVAQCRHRPGQQCRIRPRRRTVTRDSPAPVKPRARRRATRWVSPSAAARPRC